ncbi:MAG: nitrilase-related carbon-nitrogen hydrolase, partial [Longimicrobiales bacterium]
MPNIVKCGLIQAANACPADEEIATIRDANIALHVELIEQAGREGVQILCMQEIFTGPYFCAEQTTRWYDATERIPEGPTTRLMQELAEKHDMVIIVPLYEEDAPGVYYNTA